jgi:sugar phosphate isomerase/epimerase
MKESKKYKATLDSYEQRVEQGLQKTGFKSTPDIKRRLKQYRAIAKTAIEKNGTSFKLGMRAVYQKDIRSAILEAKKNGFEVLEIHLSAPQFLPQNYSPEQLKAIKSFAAKNNIILQTHSEIGQSLIQADEILRKAEKQKLKQMVMFSRQLGARCLTVHIGKAPQYHLGIGGEIKNDVTYAKHYTALFEDSVKYIISIAPKDLYIAIENDNLLPGYQKVLDKYLKTGKVFLTWDILKSYSGHAEKLKDDQWKFVQRNIQHVRNIHVSGPRHGSIQGCEKKFAQFFELFKNKNLPMIIEIISLEEALKAKTFIQDL